MAASISTGKGDRGESGNIRGERLPKNHPLFMLLGDLDELSSQLGLCKALMKKSLRSGIRTGAARLEQIQQDLQNLMALYAGGKPGSKADYRILETWQDSLEKKRGPLPARLILPGRTVLSGHLHVARAQCRRAERSLVSFIAADKNTELQETGVYLNRLSDLLFMMAELL